MILSPFWKLIKRGGKKGRKRGGKRSEKRGKGKKERKIQVWGQKKGNGKQKADFVVKILGSF